MTDQKQLDFARSIDDVLDYVKCDRIAPDPNRTVCGLRDLAEPEACLWSEDGVDPFSLDAMVGYFRNVRPEHVPNYDFSACRFVDDCLDGQPGMVFYRLKEATIKEARGTKIRSPHVAWLYEMVVPRSSSLYHVRRRLVNFYTNGDWIELDRVTQSAWFRANLIWDAVVGARDDGPQTTTNVCNLLMSVGFNRDFEWRVVLNGKASLSLPTTAAGAKAVLSQRDRPESLRNWVEQHCRRTGSVEDEEAEIKDRERLHGRTPFRWLGLDCELVVCPWDVRLNERIRVSREAEKRDARRRM